MKTKMMRNVYVTLLMMFFTGSIFAQLGINTDGTDPDNSAMLDVKSANRGFLPPRMTTVQINAIANPAEGLMVYNISIHSPVYYDGTGWKRTDGQFYIGESYGGGIIFYIDGTGNHGLIASPSDQSTGALWGCYGTSIGGTGTAIGTGQANTTAIVNGCSESDIAARICDNLVLNGYSDWFLPSKDELNQLFIQSAGVGGFSSYLYWSSSESSADSAWGQHFDYGGQAYDGKANSPIYVRAVRAF